MNSPTAVLLFNLGGPDDLESVEPFLVNLFTDREIIQLPGGRTLQPWVARLIAKMRGPSVRNNYRRIGGGSPQLRITRQQAEALEDRLNVPNQAAYRVFVAMRYSRPTADDALEAIAAAGITRIVTLTLFPHWSKATTGSSRNEFERVLASPRWRDSRFEITHIEQYADHPLYLEALTATVRTAWDDIPEARRARTVLLFSAHGLPQRFIDEGDPYVEHIDATRFGVLERLNVPNRQLLAFQSRTGPVRWIGPGTEEVLSELGDEGVSDVLVIPLSFVSDHIETLYEVDMLFADAARAAGITGYYRPPALNCHPLFIDALASLVTDHAGIPARHREYQHAHRARWREVVDEPALVD
ncbi:MAG TPA: ferrochelatase [Vicinamibacterales bacterium]|nr:ferrochelatase [Vicinamibacterales bacterium]